MSVFTRRVGLATWNPDALRTSLVLAMAMNRDVLALQDLHVDEATAIGLYPPFGFSILCEECSFTGFNHQKTLLI